MSNCEKCDDTGWYTITAAEFQREHDVITDLSPDQMMSFPCDHDDLDVTTVKNALGNWIVRHRAYDVSVEVNDELELIFEAAHLWVKQQEKPKLETHPEETCQRCGRPNIWSWSVDSDRFNVAVEALGLTVAAIICPVCFAEGHKKATGLQCTWRLIPADGGFHFPPDEIIHQTPPKGSGIMPCCGRTPFEVSRTDRMATDTDLVTCPLGATTE